MTLPATASGVIVADSITKVGPESSGHVVVNGSHGGMYPAYLAARLGLRAVVFSDAGVGLEDAGIAGVRALDETGLAAAAVDYRSARIGNGEEMLWQGRISFVNRTAAATGCAPGQSTEDCVEHLLHAAVTTRSLPEHPEARHLIRSEPDLPKVWALDSVSITDARDDGAIIVTGSHGALLGDDPASAVRSSPLAAIFSDAGGGPNLRGTSRLPALDARGIAGGTVAAASARIGDGASAYQTGVLSVINACASELGANVGMSVIEFVDAVLSTVRTPPERVIG